MKLSEYLPELPHFVEQGQRLDALTNTLSLMKAGADSETYRAPTIGLDQVVNTWLRQQLAYRMQMVLDLSTIAMTVEEIRAPLTHITNEVFRRGLHWASKWAVKCSECETESQELVDKCPKCGSLELREPDLDQRKRLEKFLDDCNVFDESLEQVLRRFHFDLNALDDAFLYLVKEYADAEDKTVRSKVIEVRHLNPALVEFDLDMQGLPKNSHFFCYIHREVVEAQPGQCPQCFRTLVPAMYRYWHRGKAMYLLDSEIIHQSKFSPSETFGWCFDPETEVLTRGGFKKVGEVTFSDEVATLNRTSGVLEYQHPVALTAIPWAIDMVRITGTGKRGQRVEQLVTPDHRLWVSDDNAATFKQMRAKEILGKVVRVPTAPSLWYGTTPKEVEIGGVDNHRIAKFREPLRIRPEGWVEFLGYFLSEGWCYRREKNGTFEIGVAQAADSPYVKPIEASIAGLGVSWHRQEKTTKNSYNDGRQIYQWRISDPRLGRYLKGLGLAGAKNKGIPLEVKSYSRPLLGRLFNALMNGDGANGGRTYYTSSEQLRDDVMEVALKLGYSVRCAKHPKSGGWYVSVNRRDKTAPVTAVSARGESTKVYCLQVPNETLFVRYKGYCSVSMNSPILTIFEKALTIIGMDKNLYRYFYERRMPASMVLVFTDDPDSLRRERANIAAQMRLDPNYTPLVAVSARGGRGRVDMVRLFHTMEEMNYLPVRDEIRERIAAMWGVTPTWQGVVEAYGGLAAQSQQLTVMGRVVEGDQRLFHEKVFKQLLEAFGVTDWKLELLQPEEKAEATRIAFAQQRISIASMLFQLGFDIKIKAESTSVDDVDFEVSGQAQRPEAMMGGAPLGGAPTGEGEGEGGEAPPEEEGAAEQPTEERGQPLAFMMKATKGWVQQLAEAGFLAPMIKSVDPEGNILFEVSKTLYLAKFSGGKLLGVERFTPVRLHRHGQYPPHDLNIPHNLTGRAEPQRGQKAFEPEEPDQADGD